MELHDFRTLVADFKMERPLVDGSFTVWALPPSSGPIGGLA